MNLLKKIADELRKSADDIEEGVCGLNQNELLDLSTLIFHQELTKYEAALFLNMSVRTFDRRIHDGYLPPGRHNINSKNLIWYKDELIKADCK